MVSRDKLDSARFEHLKRAYVEARHPASYAVSGDDPAVLAWEIATLCDVVPRPCAERLAALRTQAGE